MSDYRIAVNLELTGKCNARCVMCPRDAVEDPQIMSLDTLRQAVARLDPRDVFRVVLAGYGEPTTHPRFEECLDILRAAPVPVDLVTNGQLLDPARLAKIDGLVNIMIVSYSNIDPQVYERVHVNLDHARVTENILAARRLFRKTQLAISLTPVSESLATLPRTIEWLRAQGVNVLTMSPTLYDRAGTWSARDPQAGNLRRFIRTHRLHSQELDFVPSLRELYAQWRANRHRCIPRNTDLPIAADGSYQYCFNDIRHSHALGHVRDMTVREALARREAEGADERLCDACGVRRRYGPVEVTRVVFDYLRTRAAQAA